ncbi:hypothetical protein [Phaeodactylibacter sp.]|jgi:hypothetical protein|uniref:hypothetical protein n=1 Tax=Phaeodactylibacter sp. TaxID=1940289 RepID=UPI0025D6D55F|nr:hypothetical protein [Phaeodactylibacter sp.]MCI4648038.1 hypothetical protein [Phaeodactylibacter sp.]MCI5091077.1 hypothetical protein [Phaeodactylibacter sp.]
MMTKFKVLISIVVFSFPVLLFTSCEKTDETIENISESDAAEIIEASLQANAGGLVTNIEDIVEQLVTAVTSGELCDTLYSSTIEEDFQGAKIQASYTSELSYEMTCNAVEIPQTATFSILTESMYSSSRIESDDNGNFTGNATNLQPSSLTMNINGDYSQTGTQALNFMEQKNISSTLTATLSTLQISKQDFEIESGNAILSWTGSTSDETFSFEGTIVFNGGNTATLTINGTTYQIDWN